jgi:hypothetical protein
MQKVGYGSIEGCDGEDDKPSLKTIKKVDSGCRGCPHPGCAVSGLSGLNRRFHLQNVHCAEFTKGMKRSRSETEAEIKVDEDQPKKRHCINRAGLNPGDALPLTMEYDFIAETMETMASRPNPGKERTVRSEQSPFVPDDSPSPPASASIFPSGPSWSTSATGHTSLTTPVTGTCTDSFKDPLGPALFVSESSTSQPSPSEPLLDTSTPQSDGEDELDPTPQVDGWVEVLSPDGTLILQELSDHEAETRAPHTDAAGKEQRRAMQFPQDKPVSASHNRLAPRESDLVTINCPICGTGVLQSSKIPKRRLNVRQQIAFCNAHKVKDAKFEWARRGYPRIGWRTLNSRFEKFSSSLRRTLNGDSPSFYRSELESAVARKECVKYRCMENATAGYYGPRGQQIM